MKKASKKQFPPNVSYRSLAVRTLRYMGKQRIAFFLSLLLALIYVAGVLAVPLFVGEVIDLLLDVPMDFSWLTHWLILIAAAAATAALAQWLMLMIHNRITFRLLQDVRNDAFARLTHLPVGRIESEASGKLQSRILADAESLADGLLLGFSNLFTGVATVGATLVFLFLQSPLIALVVLLVTPLSLFVSRFIAKHTRDMFRLQAEARAEETAFADEMIAGMKIVRSFGQQDRMAAQFDEKNETLRSAALRAVFYSSLVNPGTRFVSNLVYAGVALTGGFLALGGSFTVGALTCCLSYVNQYTKPFNDIAGVITELQNSFVCAARLFELIDEPVEEEHPTASLPEGKLWGEVRAENLCFSYVPGRPLFDHLSFTVQPGQHVAIVGPTGCGKTTLIHLLLRFYDAQAGSLCLDGVEITALPRQQLRAAFGMVLQESWIMTASVRDNIALGWPEAPEEAVHRAAVLAHADDFIRQLPQGYDTLLTEGSLLSEGQKQLLCIARVLLMQPPVLLLDEATSSIDTRAEKQIQNALENLQRGRTSFTVAHRLSTIRDADLILVMRDGRIVEQGTHETLLRAGGFYATLYAGQFDPNVQKI